VRVTFFRFAERKSPKKGRPCSLRPHSPVGRAGQPAVLVRGARCGTRCALRATLKQPQRVSQRRRVSFGTRPPPALRSSAHPEGLGEPTSTRAIAALGPRTRRRFAPRPRGRVQRWPVWLFGWWAVQPLLAAPAAGRLRGGMRVGARMLRALTRRSCLNGAPQARSEFCGAPRNRPDAGLPLRNAKGSQTGGRLLFGDFLLANQEKVTAPPGAHPGSRPQHRHAASISQRANPGFDKLSPRNLKSPNPMRSRRHHTQRQAPRLTCAARNPPPAPPACAHPPAAGLHRCRTTASGWTAPC